MAVSYGTYTITEVQEGSQIWTTTVAPVSPNYTFTISNLTGDSETSIKVGDIIMYSYYRYTVLSISDDGTTVLTGNRVSIRGATGAASVTYTLIVSNLAIIKDKNGNISPTTITLTAKSQTGSSAMANYAGRFKIETTTNNSTWTTQYTSSANEATKNWTVIDDIIAIRCSLYLKDGTTTLLDQQTIPIVSDGADGTNGTNGADAYTVILTNENHTFTGNTTSALASEIECNVIAYKGTTQVAATIGTITGQPTGMTTSLLNNGTVNSAFKVTVTTSMVARNGILNVPITVDGKTFTKKFTYGLALKGSAGTSENLLMDVYASSLEKVDAPWSRYLSDASNSTITGEFIAEDNLPDPNATHFYRITDSSASTKGRGLCFYSSGTPPFITGHTYRIGCWVRKHAGNPKMNITLGSYGSWMPTQRIIDNTDWEWFEVVHSFGETDASKTTQSDTYKRLYFYFYNNNIAGSSLDMCGFRMEEVQTNSGTARNLLLGTEKLTNWGATNGATISDGVATFPTITSNSWREIYPAKNFKYDLIKNQYAIFSIKVKGNVDEKCCINLSIGVDTTETAYIRKKYLNQYVYFVGTGEWQTICSALPIFDYMFSSGSGTVDFNDCWVTVRIGAVNNYWNGFQVKEPQLCLGTIATSWSRAPEDVDEEVSNLRTDLQSQIDEKIQTYYQATAPSWSSVTDRAKHNGDLWYCTESDPYTGYEAKNVYRYDSTNNTWVEYSATSELFDAVDGKSTIFYGTTSDTFDDVDTGDYLVDSTDGSSYRWNGTQWVKVTDYKTAIDNIEVGGRNLLKGSDVTNTSLTTSLLGGTSTQVIPSGTVITLSVQIDADDVVWASSGNRRIGVASSIVKDGGGNQYIEAWAAMTGRTGTGIDKTFDTSFHGRVKSTYTLQGELPLDKAFNLHTQSVTSGTVKVSRPKLEIGNKATDWTPAPEDINEAIDNINAIGINLIPLSENLKSFTIENSTRSTVTYTDDSCTIVNTYGSARYGIYYNVDVEPNSTYTLSFQASNVSGTNVNYSVGNRTPNQTASWYDITNGYKNIIDGKNVCTFTIPDTVTVVRIYICAGSLDGTVTISNLKLETGEKATEWIPSPKDVQDARKVAINYLSADSTGIMVADMQDGEQTPSSIMSGRNVFIDNDSVNIRDGQNTLASFTGNNTKFYDIEQNREVASFGTNGVRVGSEDEQHFIVDSESIQAINENGSSIFSVQSTGGTITTEIIVAKGGNSQPHTDWEVYLNGGSSVPQNTFYAKEYSLLIDIDNSINTFNSMTVSVNDGNFQNASVVRTQYQNSAGMTVYSRHLVTLPPFSFQYGTEKTFRYQVEGVYISDKGNTYRYSSTIHIPYDGQRTITMEAVGGTLTQTSGSVSGDNTAVPYGGNSTIWGDIYSSLGYAKAPAMTFGTRGRAGTVAPLSVTIGEELYANNNNQLSIGRYNVNNDEFSPLAFAIGNGTSDDDRSNAFNVDWDGNVENMGDLEVGESLIVDGSANDIPNITINKESTNTTDYIKCLDSGLNAKFRVLGSGGVITAGDVSVGGAETVNGNLYAKGRLLYNSTSTPLFKVVTRTIDNISIGVNTGAYPSVAVNESGYTPIAISSITLDKASSDGTTYGWCVVQSTNMNGQTLNFYVGNWNTSSAAKIKMVIKVLCIRTSAL